jgi:hypothetical protein
MSEHRCSQCGQLIPDSTPALQTVNESERGLEQPPQQRATFANIWTEPFVFSKTERNT